MAVSPVHSPTIEWVSSLMVKGSMQVDSCYQVTPELELRCVCMCIFLWGEGGHGRQGIQAQFLSTTDLRVKEVSIK